MKTEVILAFVFGVVFLAVLLALIVWIPNPTPAQLMLFRITIALAAGGIAAVIPGFLNVNISLGKRLVIAAGGALAVFIITYFYNPPSIGNH